MMTSNNDPFFSCVQTSVDFDKECTLTTYCYNLKTDKERLKAEEDKFWIVLESLLDECLKTVVKEHNSNSVKPGILINFKLSAPEFPDALDLSYTDINDLDGDSIIRQLWFSFMNPPRSISGHKQFRYSYPDTCSIMAHRGM